MRFFDASALVKRYVRERGSARVRRLLRAGDVAISRLSEVEVVSAFARLAREQAITSVQRDRAVAAFLTDVPSWTIVEVIPSVTGRARELLLRHTLRAGNALQLGAALALQQGVGRPLIEFVAYNVRLVSAARAEGLFVGRRA